jgi:hypothetical protein
VSPLELANENVFLAWADDGSGGQNWIRSWWKRRGSPGALTDVRNL